MTFCSFGRASEQEGETERDVSSYDLFSDWPQQPGLGWAEARSQNLPRGSLGPSTAVFPGVLAGKLHSMLTSAGTALMRNVRTTATT